MRQVQESDIRNVMESGNGAIMFLPASDGEVIKLSYLWGKLRVDILREDSKIPLSARRGRGGDIAAVSAN